MESANAEEVATQLRPSIVKFHEASKGRIEAIGLLFSEMAKQPLPPQVICQILGMDEEVVKEAFDTGNVPSASEEQLFNAVKKSVDPEDTAETYAPILERHVKRFENAKMVTEELKAQLSAMHSHCSGDVEKVAAFFSDLAPAPQTGNPMPEGMINALLRIQPAAKTCSLADFLDCFERNLDIADSVATIQPVLAKHIAA